MLLSIRNEVLKHDNLKILKTVNDKVTVFCSICGKSFSASKTNHVPDHLKGLSHVKAVQLRKGQQSNLITISGPKRARIEDEFAVDLSKAWISAGIPLHTLSNDNLKYYQTSIPSVPTLSNVYAESAFSELFCKVKKNIFLLKLYLSLIHI